MYLNFDLAWWLHNIYNTDFLEPWMILLFLLATLFLWVFGFCDLQFEFRIGVINLSNPNFRFFILFFLFNSEMIRWAPSSELSDKVQTTINAIKISLITRRFTLITTKILPLLICRKDPRSVTNFIMVIELPKLQSNSERNKHTGLVQTLLQFIYTLIKQPSFMKSWTKTNTRSIYRMLVSSYAQYSFLFWV